MIDPLADLYSSASGYNYTLNNPIKFVDPNGEVIVVYDDNDHGIYQHDFGTTKEEISENREKNNDTSGGGTWIGQTPANRRVIK